MDTVKITPLPAYDDNYIWIIEHNQQAIAVDPGLAEPVFDYLEQHQLTLEGILVTHHHWDHTNGIEQLSNRFEDLTVIAGDNSQVKYVTRTLKEGQSFRLAELDFNLLSVPGHTLDHYAYLVGNHLFCGDTLFSAGCGRLFEGTPAQMHNSLNRLKNLPDDTRVYCTHEYTQANLCFALAVEPNNPQLLAYCEKVDIARKQGQPSLPSSIAQEKQVNPFLRCHLDSVTQAVAEFTQQTYNSELETFTALRQWKDQF